MIRASSGSSCLSTVVWYSRLLPAVLDCSDRESSELISSCGSSWAPFEPAPAASWRAWGAAASSRAASRRSAASTASAAADVKRVHLELGGKSPNIILDDADFDTALLSGLAVCFHAGQGCAIPTRMLLPRSRYAEGVEKLKGIFPMAPYGDPQRPDVMMGPLVSAKQRDRVLGYIETGIKEGATLALGGGRPSHLPKGWYVEPTLFVDVDNSMTIAQEEIFGPVLVVIPFEDDDDAVRIANNSIYGLSGAVFGSQDRALAVARRIRTGTFSINGGNYFSPDSPFGGYKQSGIGREMGKAGLEEFLESKTFAEVVS